MIEYDGVPVTTIGVFRYDPGCRDFNPPAIALHSLGVLQEGELREIGRLSATQAEKFLNNLLQEANKQLAPAPSKLPCTVYRRYDADGEWHKLAQCDGTDTAESLIYGDFAKTDGQCQYKTVGSSFSPSYESLFPDPEYQLALLRTIPDYDKYILEEATRILTSKKEA